MRFKKITMIAVAITAIGLLGCTAPEANEPTLVAPETVVVSTNENSDMNQQPEALKAIDLERVTSETQSKVFFPQVTGFKGELLQDYMNQSLRKVAEKYNGENFTDVQIDYTVKHNDGMILSVLFKGTAEMKDIGAITIMESVNMDVGNSTNEINYDNLIKGDSDSKAAVKKLLNEAAVDYGIPSGFEAEGVRVYFEGEDIVFFYMPLSDSATDFIELKLKESTLHEYLNSDFGSMPAS